MPAFSLGFLRSGPPPPKVALLPDGLFFVRAIEVPTAADVAAQVELALESMAPFPLSQLYYGHYWVPGSGRALVFAAYRRRFTPEQIEAWEGTEVVMPAFAALLGGQPEPATTVVLAASEGLTAIHWDTDAVPSKVAFQPLAPEASEEDRARARDELLRPMPSKTIADLAGPPIPEPALNDRETVFRCGDFVSRLSREAVLALDMRDKEELVGLRRGQARALLMWRLIVGCFAAFGLMAAGEIVLLGGGLWQTARLTKLHAQAPVVEEIITAHDLANHIGELSTKRLLPLEMVTAIVGSHNELKPASVVFTRVYTNGQLGLTVEAVTPNAADINVYQNSLKALPAVASVEVKGERTQNNTANFTLLVTFKPGALQPMAPPS